MRILYGVVGEGMGHAMRSRVVLEHLVQHHDVQIMASGRARDFLAKRFEGVRKIHGFFLISDENHIRLGKTIWQNAVAAAVNVPMQIREYYDVVSQFRPEVVISDFESWSYVYAQTQRLPIVSIDNMQAINRFVHPPEIIEGDESSFKLAKAFVKSKLPFCDAYFITSFFEPTLRKPKKTKVFPPILRDEIMDAKPSRGEHLLVYQTVEGYDSLADTLKQTGVECRIYGMKRGLATEERDKNLRYMPFSEVAFAEDFASCKAVITGGGFTLIGEAVALHKPILSVPIAKQFEQIMNAKYVRALGYGDMARTLDDPNTVHRFLERLGEYEANVSKYTHDRNAGLLAALDQFLDRASAGLV